MKNIPLILFVFIYITNPVVAEDEFDWHPITNLDWSISEDESKGIHDAVMIFEKISADDENLIDEKCYYTIYRRIRILSEEGRSWGDVSVPYLRKDQKVQDIQGRTILKDGTIIQLNRSQILEKEIFKSKEMRVKQKSFYLPGVSNNCIIEYVIKLQLKNPNNLWVIAKDIYLMKGEFRWKFFKGKGLAGLSRDLLSDFITPNYIWLNTEKALNVEMEPSIKDPKEVVFSIFDVKAFENELYTLPDNSLRANLRAYYGGGAAPEAFWGKVSNEKLEEIQAFTKKDDKLKSIIPLFSNIPEKERKIEAAYEWIQKNLKNTLYEDETKDFEDIDYVNDVLEYGYGNSYEINLVFYDLLRELNIDAKIGFVTDRDESIFEKKAKYWQFDRSVVAFQESLNDAYTYYSPGMRFLPNKSLPWYNEGVTVLLTGSVHQQFNYTPFSIPHSNLIKRHFKLEMNANFEIEGSIIEILRGHPARSIRLGLFEENNREQINFLKDWVDENFTGIEPDSFDFSGLEEIEKPVTLQYVIETDAPWYLSCDRVMVQPFQFCAQQENIFHATERKFPLVFEYARELVETLTLKLPEEWEVEALPEQVKWSNKIGSIETSFSELQAKKIISAQRRIIFNTPFIRNSDYKLVKEFYNYLQNSHQSTVILKQLVSGIPTSTKIEKIGELD